MGKEYLIDDLEFLHGDISLTHFDGIEKQFTVLTPEVGNENSMENLVTPLGEVFSY